MIPVDFMAGEYGGAGKSHRTQKVQDVRARKARGCDLVFDSPERRRITGELPGQGGKDTVDVNISGIVPFLVMKGMALDDRVKEKDAYDIVYTVRFFPGGSKGLADRCRPLMNNKLVQEGFGKMRKHFISIDSTGPSGNANFQEIQDPDARAIEQRRAFELVNQLLDMLDVKPYG